MQSITVVFWSTLSVLILNVNALNYSNRWIVEIEGGNNEANRLARQHGFVNVGKVGLHVISNIKPCIKKGANLAREWSSALDNNYNSIF